MANHRKPRDARANGRSGRRVTALRGGTLVVTITFCLVGGFRLFASASDAAGGVHAASISGSRHAKLAAPGDRHHRGHASDVRPSGAPNPASSPSAVPAQISGRSVTAVGDSVMVASTPALRHALPGIYIDAMVGRQFGTGLQVIADLKARGMLRRIVVVGLGTNGTVTSEQISKLFTEIGPARKLVLVNTFEDRPWEQEVNSVLATAVRDHPGVVLANWYATVRHRTNLLWPDGIHPQPSGGVVYAKMLKAALDRLASS